MRSALFILGMLINMGLQTLAESNGLKIEYSDSMTSFVACVFVIFFLMDVIDMIKRERAK